MLKSTNIGELLDKITILSIELARISDLNKRESILLELNNLNKIAELEVSPVIGLRSLYLQLYRINESLWDIEHNQRDYEKNKYASERIRIQQEINKLLSPRNTNNTKFLNHYQ